MKVYHTQVRVILNFRVTVTRDDIFRGSFAEG